MIKYIFLLEFLTTFSEAFIGYLFLNLFSKTKCKMKILLLLSLSLTFLGLIANYISLFSVITTAIAVIYIGVTYTLATRNRIKENILNSILYFILIYNIDFFTLSIISLILHRPTLVDDILIQYSFLRCLYLICCKIILFLFYISIKKILHCTDNRLRTLPIVTIIGSIGIFIAMNITMKTINLSTTFNWLLLFTVIISTSLSTYIYKKYSLVKETENIIMVKSRMMEDKYLSMKQQQEENSTLYHDLHNHLLVISELLKKDNIEAQKYIDNIITPINNIVDKTWTGNQFLDFVLNLKQKEADGRSIQVTIKSDPILFQDIMINDLCTIFTNLLDNSIEACQRNQENARWISISIRKINEIVLITIENAIEHKPVTHHNKLISLKENPTLHGLGIKSIISSVKKYGGIFEYEILDYKFCSKITFFNVKA